LSSLARPHWRRSLRRQTRDAAVDLDAIKLQTVFGKKEEEEKKFYFAEQIKITKQSTIKQ